MRPLLRPLEAAQPSCVWPATVTVHTVPHVLWCTDWGRPLETGAQITACSPLQPVLKTNARGYWGVSPARAIHLHYRNARAKFNPISSSKAHTSKLYRSTPGAARRPSKSKHVQSRWDIPWPLQAGMQLSPKNSSKATAPRFPWKHMGGRCHHCRIHPT